MAATATVSVTVAAVMRALEALAPRHLAAEWDNPGLAVGDPAAPVRKVLVALDFDEAVLAEAREAGAEMVVVHHPPIFRPINTLREDRPGLRLLAEAIRAGVAVASAHTNLDIAPGGINDALAAAIGLTGTAVLAETGRDRYLKLAVFVPVGHEETVAAAIGAAGAGYIGNYSHCTFRTSGTGTFLPQAGANPFLGEVGRLERAAEVRIETILPERLRDRVVAAMLAAHPYEEVAYDLYPLANEAGPEAAWGLGRVGRFDGDFVALLDKVRSVVAAGVGGDATVSLRVAGDPGLARLPGLVAVCGGAGGKFAAAAAARGAAVYITGDVGYHEAAEAVAAGLVVVDAGHDTTERFYLGELANKLAARLAGDDGGGRAGGGSGGVQVVVARRWAPLWRPA